MTETFVIRKLRPEDCEGLYNLLVEHSEFQSYEDDITVSAEILRRDAFKEKSFECFVAEGTNVGEDNGILLGMAIFYFNYQGFVGKTALLDHLYVKQKYRGHGIGSALWKAVAAEVIQRGALKLTIYVINWNNKAQTFYKNRACVDFTTEHGFQVYEVDKKDLEKELAQ